MSGDAMHSEEMTLFRDMARRAFEQEISPHFEQWEEDHIVPRELWNWERHLETARFAAGED